MANKIMNDRGEWVTSVGAPNSMANLAVRRPWLLGELQLLRNIRRDNMCPLTIDHLLAILEKQDNPINEKWEQKLIAEFLGIEYEGE